MQSEESCKDLRQQAQVDSERCHCTYLALSGVKSLCCFLMAIVRCAGSAITGPVAKECADLWPRIASAANSIV